MSSGGKGQREMLLNRCMCQTDATDLTIFNSPRLSLSQNPSLGFGLPARSPGGSPRFDSSICLEARPSSAVFRSLQHGLVRRGWPSFSRGASGQRVGPSGPRPGHVILLLVSVSDIPGRFHHRGSRQPQDAPQHPQVPQMPQPPRAHRPCDGEAWRVGRGLDGSVGDGEAEVLQGMLRQGWQ